MSGIHATAIVEDGAQLGADVEIGAMAYVGPNVVLGDGVKLHHRATVIGRTTLGERVEVHPSAVVGADPHIMGIKPEDIGTLEIGARTIVREQVSVHTGSRIGGGVSRVGSDCFLMAVSHYGHDCIMGDHCVMAPNVVVGGHSIIADHVWIGGSSAVHQFTRIGRHAMVGGGSILVGDLIPFGLSMGNRAALAGLNLVGLKRRGFERSTIQALRQALKSLFEGDGTFKDRLAATEAGFSGNEHVMEVIQFIRDSGQRPLCQPE